MPSLCPCQRLDLSATMKPKSRRKRSSRRVRAATGWPLPVAVPVCVGDLHERVLAVEVRLLGVLHGCCRSCRWSSSPCPSSAPQPPQPWGSGAVSSVPKKRSETPLFSGVSSFSEFAWSCKVDAGVKPPRDSELRAACREFGPSLLGARGLEPCSNVKCGTGDCSRVRLEGLVRAEVGAVRGTPPAEILAVAEIVDVRIRRLQRRPGRGG